MRVLRAAARAAAHTTPLPPVSPRCRTRLQDVQATSTHAGLAPRRRAFAGGGVGGGGASTAAWWRAAALPSYRQARKSEEEVAAEAADPPSANGPRFPFKDEFEVARGVALDAAAVVATLAPLMSERRIARIEQVCAARTFNVLPIVEHVYDMGNLAAVCRSADALGFGAVHVVRNTRDTRYKQSTRSSAGADKWLDVQVWDGTAACVAAARARGFQVVATHLGPGSVDVSAVDWTRPTAFIMGNEQSGVSDDAVALADACAVVPMAGFVDSYNLSVAAALVMYEARRQRQQALGALGDLDERERALLKALFFLRHKGQTPQQIQLLLRRPPPQWQAHRGGGDWDGKTFSLDGGGDEAQRLQTTSCYYWDGACCWGERLLWPGRTCRYHGAHNRGVSTLNKEKLRQMCAVYGLPPPDLTAPPPPPLGEAAAAAAVSQREAEAALAATASAQ